MTRCTPYRQTRPCRANLAGQMSGPIRQRQTASPATAPCAGAGGDAHGGQALPAADPAPLASQPLRRERTALVSAVPAASRSGPVPPGRAPATAVAIAHADGPSVGSLCTGNGWLDLAILAVLGGHLAWIAGTGQPAALALAARFPGVSSLGDPTHADWASAPPVNVITARFPSAGRGGIWANIAGAVGRLRPGIAFMDTAGGPRSQNPARARAELASLGYETRCASLWVCGTGAAHRHHIIFILAWQPAGLSRLRAAACPSGGEPHPAGNPGPQRRGDRNAGGDRGLAAPVQCGNRRGNGRRPPGPPAPRPCSPPLPFAARPGVAAAGTPGQNLHHAHRRGERSAAHQDRHGGASWAPFRLTVRLPERIPGPAVPPAGEQENAGQAWLSTRSAKRLTGLTGSWVTGTGKHLSAQVHGLDGTAPQQAAAMLRLLIETAARFPSTTVPGGQRAQEPVMTAGTLPSGARCSSGRVTLLPGTGVRPGRPV